jgi:aquaporin Z
VVTAPGEAGTGVAFLAELLISFGMMMVVLVVSNSRHARLTGLFAGCLVFLYITLEDPLSGMSMNPARTFGSELVGGVWTGWWIYFTAPPLGMLLAAQAYLTVHGLIAVRCAKLHHENAKRCIFCEYQHAANRSANP